MPSNNMIAPELTKRIARLPFLRLAYTAKEGHVLIVTTPEGLADRVAVLGKGARALETLQIIVTMIEGVLAHLGYEDPASARIDMSRWLTIRWETQELIDNNVSLSDFQQQVTQFGNELVGQTTTGLYWRVVRFDDDPDNEYPHLFCAWDGLPDEEDDSNVFFFGLDPDQAVPGFRYELDGWEIVSY